MDIADNTNCNIAISNVATYAICFISLLAISHGIHILLKPLSQPRIISETIVGLAISNLPSNWISRFLNIESIDLQNMKFLTDFGMTLYMFALGLEMDPLVLFRIPKREAIVAYTGMLFTFILMSCTSYLLKYGRIDSHLFILTFSIIISSTGSPLLTRMLTDLKIGKSDIGKFAISAAVYSDLITILIICVGYVLFKPESAFRLRRIMLQNPDEYEFMSSPRLVPLGATLFLQIILTLVAGPFIVEWVNSANPPGKTFKGSHLVLSVAFATCVGSISPLMGFSPVLSSFITGLLLPREGRITKFVLNKVNYFLVFVFYPYFFVWVGLAVRFNNFEFRTLGSWARLFGFFAVTTVGKVIGTLLSGLIFGFQWPESIMLASLLNVKGHLHIYLTIVAMQKSIISDSTCIGIILAIFLKIVYIPVVAQYIIQRARKRVPNQPLALQWHDPTKELRILLCFHGPENVPCGINFMEISKGTGDPGILVYATDMVQLTDEIATTLITEGVDNVEVTDTRVVQARDQITAMLQEYVENDGDGVTLRRAMALATYNTMHQEICTVAEDSTISLIVLPFHNGPARDEQTNAKHTGFRYVNKKVLRNAPCSIAIMMDRGFGAINQILKSTSTTLSIVVIFIGGKDDREALAYASRIASQRGIKLTIMRFLVETDVENNNNNNTRKTYQQQEEMKLDDECFANFYEMHVAGGKVSYLEKHLVNSAQAYTTLQSLEGQYGLFIVGRGGRVNSMLTMGMNDWEQCPELGPLGDILCGSNFSNTASVLIIQQHNPKVEHGGAPL